MTPWQRLQQRIAVECEVTLPEGAVRRRTYAGRHQLAAGAYRWWIDGSPIYSYQTVSKLLKAASLHLREDRYGLLELTGEDK